jgi:hypothetical protein
MRLQDPWPGAGRGEVHAYGAACTVAMYDAGEPGRTAVIARMRHPRPGIDHERRSIAIAVASPPPIHSEAIPRLR